MAACKKPVVSAIGHETDFTLCDFAADLRAPTPSAAAECVVPLRSELLEEVAALRQALVRSTQTAMAARRAELALMRERLNAAHPAAGISRARETVHRQRELLRAAMQAALDRAHAQLALARGQMTLLSPQSVLSRGYAMVMKGRTVVSSVASLRQGDTVTLVLADGCAEAGITEKQTKVRNRRNDDDAKKETEGLL